MPSITVSLETKSLVDLDAALKKINLSRSKIIQMSLEKVIPEIEEMACCAELMAEKRAVILEH